MLQIRGCSSMAEQREFPLRQMAVSRPTQPLHDVREIKREVAAPFIEQWHYEHKTPTGKNVYFGCFVAGDLFAVASFGWGAAMKLSNGNYSIEGYLERHYPELGIVGSRRSVLHLQRLCRVGSREDKGPIPLSQFLAACRRLIRRHSIGKEARGIISYSDPSRGHSGGIYRAAGFRHLGTTASEMHVIDENGVIRHRRVAYKFMKSRNSQAERKGKPIPFPTLAAARKHLGFEPHKTSPRDRWFLAL